MKKRFFSFFLILNVTVLVFAARIRVVTTYPYIADIVAKIGAERVEVVALANGYWDPHQVVPKPSFIAKMRRANLLVINGAQLEIGWLPPLLSQANNPRLLPGERGFLDLSTHVQLIEVPTSVSRALGDVHPEGNPHFLLDPYNVPLLAAAIAARLKDIDPDNSADYEIRLQEFGRRWQESLTSWENRLHELRGLTIIQYHQLFDYLIHRFAWTSAGTIEPLPGIPPNPRYIDRLISVVRNSRVRFILQDVYHSPEAARFISDKTGAKMIVLPHDVDAVPEASDIFSLFDEIVRRLTR